MPAKPDRLLSIYLNDHLAGATLGVEMARRLRESNSEDAAMAAPLADVCSEIETDRATLEHVMERLDIRRSRTKPAGAWAAEKVGRFKLNGQLTGYSPLSRLVELELLLIGITGKLRLWKGLEHSVGDSRGDFAFAQLAKRAERQRETVAELHLQAAARAFQPEGASNEKVQST
jgi:hypothetical protein